MSRECNEVATWIRFPGNRIEILSQEAVDPRYRSEDSWRFTEQRLSPIRTIADEATLISPMRVQACARVPVHPRASSIAHPCVPVERRGRGTADRASLLRASKRVGCRSILRRPCFPIPVHPREPSDT